MNIFRNINISVRSIHPYNRFFILMMIIEVAFSFSTPAIAAEHITLFNLSSAENRLPASAPADCCPALSSVSSLTDGTNIYPVTMIDTTLFISATIGPMSSLMLSPSEKSPFPSPVAVSDANIAIEFDTFKINAVRTGLFWNQERIFSTMPDFSHWELIHESAAVVRLRKNQLVADIYSTGAIRLAADEAVRLKIEQPQMISKLQELLVLRPLHHEDIILPNHEIMLFHDAFLLSPGTKPITFNRDHTLSMPKDSQVWITTCTNREKAQQTLAALSYPLVAQEDGEQLAVEKETYAIKISGTPDFADSIWMFTTPDSKPFAEWQFQKDDSTRRAYLTTFRWKNDIKSESIDFMDFSGRGIFLQGNLLRGGSVFCGKAGHHGAVDLDDDGDGDLFLYGITLTGPDKRKIEARGYNFDMLDLNATYFHVGSKKPGQLEIQFKGPYLGHTTPYTWYFGKTCHYTKYDGALRGFEEQIHYRIQSHEEEMIQGPAILYMKTTDDNIDRLGMGAFGGTDEHNLDWNIQMDPLETHREQSPSFRICEYGDPFGNRARFTSSVYPSAWNGKALPLYTQTSGALDWSPFEAWEKITQRDYFELAGFRAVFVPEGRMHRASECMYSGMAQTGHRIEYGTESVRPLKLYYSPLFGALHMKGALHGHQGFAAGHDMLRQDAIRTTLHRLDAVDMPDRFIAWRDINAIQGARIEGPMYLAYMDTDRDGYQDTYLYDAENNGIFDRTLRYTKQSKTVECREGNIVSAWSAEYPVEEVAYLPGNYNKIEQLYLQGLEILPEVIRTSLSDSGIPSTLTATRSSKQTMQPGWRRTTPPLFVTLGHEWNVCLGLDLYHAGNRSGGWTDMSPLGFSTLAMQAAIQGLTLDTLDQPFLTERLDQLDILVMPSPIVPLTTKEQVCLLRWIHNGGSLFITPLGNDILEKERMATLCSLFDVNLTAPQFDARASVQKYWVTYNQFQSETAGIQIYGTPAPEQKIEHFSSLDPDLLEHFDFLSCVGFSLHLPKTFRTVLSYEEKPVIAMSELGKGQIYISGINIFANKFTGHAQYAQPEADNAELLGRLMRKTFDECAPPGITFAQTIDHGYSCSISGRGGTVRFPAPDNADVLVNGHACHVERAGQLFKTTLPPGNSTLEIKEATP